jgi:hypothetical protein
MIVFCLRLKPGPLFYDPGTNFTAAQAIAQGVERKNPTTTLGAGVFSKRVKRKKYTIPCLPNGGYHYWAVCGHSVFSIQYWVMGIPYSVFRIPYSVKWFVKPVGLGCWV